MFKIVLNPKQEYAEEYQSNSIRWMIISSQGSDTYKQESAWLKCKDFFNDVVYTIQTGDSFSIYGFNAGSMNLPKKEESFYLLLKNLTPQFKNNLALLNEWLASQGIPIISAEFQDECLIALKPFYLRNTYNISLISLILRIINCNKEFKNFDEIKKYKIKDSNENNKWETVVKKNVFFTLPEELKDYIWYCGSNFNSKKEIPNYQIPGLVHNNGVINWGEYF